MRLIDADAFAEFMKDAIKQQKYEDTKIDGLLTVADVIEAVISELDGTSLAGFKNAPTIEPEPHWIPCSERLPETEEQVLIYAWNVHYVLAKYREIRTCDGVYKMAWVTEDAYNIPQEIKHEVICWMPLPEPYKDGE